MTAPAVTSPAPSRIGPVIRPRPAGAFRGFGAPQAIFAIESHLDAVAHRLGMDPLVLRRRNLLRLGDTTATGQTLTSSVAIEACFDSVVERSDYLARRVRVSRSRLDHATAPTATGLGFALFWHGGGFTGSGEKKLASRCAMSLDDEGKAVDAAFYRAIGRKLADAHGATRQG